MGSTTRPQGRDCSAEETRSASTLVSTRYSATAAGDLHLSMRPLVKSSQAHYIRLTYETLVSCPLRSRPLP
jgi:hypothetical protein